MCEWQFSNCSVGKFIENAGLDAIGANKVADQMGVGKIFCNVNANQSE